MLNVSELNYTLDSLHKTLKTDIISFSENINQRIGIPKEIKIEVSQQKTVPVLVQKTNSDTTVSKKNKKIKLKKNKAFPKDILSLFDNKQKIEILKIASSNITSANYSIDGSEKDFINKQKNINRHLSALYDKFVIGFACFLMFFIGAPLGAIIRKGGLGLPIVFAVLIFITFHFINTFGKRISQEGGLSPFMGAWMSSFILTPLALLLTYRATNDIGLINMDVILAPIQKIVKKIFPSQN
jgi:lipopolysaccharide export system permease protein